MKNLINFNKIIGFAKHKRRLYSQHCITSNVEIPYYTQLSNGLKIGWHNWIHGQAEVTILIQGSSRHESAFPSGVSHFLEKLTSLKLVHLAESHGGVEDVQYHCFRTRDYIQYSAQGPSSKFSSLVNDLSDVIFSPNLSEESIASVRQAVRDEVSSGPSLDEMLYRTAFRHNTLGLRHLCPVKSLGRIDERALVTHLAAHYRPERMVVMGSGMPREEFVQSVSDTFSSRIASWLSGEMQQLVDEKRSQPDSSVAQYIGGFQQVTRDEVQVELGIALESCSLLDPQWAAVCVVAALIQARLESMRMEGGPTFEAANLAHSDTGLLRVVGKAAPSQLDNLSSTMTESIVAMLCPTSLDELDVVKRGLMGEMAREGDHQQRTGAAIGRELLCGVETIRSRQRGIDDIDHVTVDDLRDVTQRILQSRPSVAYLGQSECAPKYKDICRRLVSKESFVPKLFQLIP